MSFDLADLVNDVTTKNNQTVDHKLLSKEQGNTAAINVDNMDDLGVNNEICKVKNNDGRGYKGKGKHGGAVKINGKNMRRGNYSTCSTKQLLGT